MARAVARALVEESRMEPGRDMDIAACATVAGTQCPAPWEYADGIDTLSFLLALSSSPVAR